MENEPETWIELAALTRNVIEFLKLPTSTGLVAEAGSAREEDMNSRAIMRSPEAELERKARSGSAST